jgi:hypothetical protein
MNATMAQVLSTRTTDPAITQATLGILRITTTASEVLEALHHLHNNNKKFSGPEVGF